LSAALTAAMLFTAPVCAQDAGMPVNITYSTITGYWEDAPAGDANPPAAEGRHGYYKLYAERQADRTSKVFLQQILSTDDGPRILSTTELKAITALKGIVTDIQPENTSGIIREPGLYARVFIKPDNDADADVWNVMLDELGEISVEKAAE
jgi:hypothetical protein